MKTLISTKPLADGRVILEISIGSTTCKMVNIREQMLPNFIRNNIASRIEGYVNHRLQILKNHGGYVTQRKLNAIACLQLKLAGSERWTLLAMARHIISMREDLICILPGQSSVFYQNNQQLLTDLHRWATETINQHNQYYAAN